MRDVPTLVLLRHSQAADGRPDHEDHERPLTAAGLRDAAAVGQWLREQGIAPDRALVSTALRTRQTWAAVGGGEPVLDARVYDATTDDLRELVAGTGPATEVLAVCGHNPALEQLAWDLDDGVGARDQTGRGLPTSGVAVFAVDDWQLGRARLTALAAPRG